MPDNLKNNTAVDVVNVIVGNKVIAENEPLVTAQAPDDLGIFSKFISEHKRRL